MAVDTSRVRDILATVKPLAAEYYRLTGKPLGVTGEVAEFVAAEKLGLELTIARTAGHDAIRHTPSGPVRIQIKGRASASNNNSGQRIGRIKQDVACDIVMLVLLDVATLEPHQIWEAPILEVLDRLRAPGSVARNIRGAMSVGDFKRLASVKMVWPQVRE